MNADGSNQTRLTNNAAHEQDPTWSPDGTKIAFATTRDGIFKVYSMNVDGSNQTRLTNTGGNEVDPSWQPLSDSTPPTLILPADITKEATDATGATVNYTATATDDRDGIVAVICSPTSESTFPIGTTTVTCTATDSSGNSASGSFTVTVKGATDQISDLKELVTSLPGLPAGTNTNLQAKLNDAITAANGGDTASACTALKDFISQVRAQAGKKKIGEQDAAKLITEAQRIQAVVGC
jgi:hypothetical protein